MPKRQAIRKVDVPKEIMGEGAFVAFRSFTMQEQRDLMTEAREISKKVESVLENYAKEIGKDRKDLTQEDINLASANFENPDEMLHFLDKALAERILDWNWVDDNDEPLEIPSKDWSVMTKLYSHEYEYIQELLSPEQATEKN